MIIWGWKSSEKLVEQGQFFCPHCRTVSDYCHQCVQEYFTLYFIPIFPTRVLGEYVQCQRCRRAFDPAFCEYVTDQPETLPQTWVCLACQNLNSATERNCLRCHTARSSQQRPPMAEPREVRLQDLLAPPELPRRRAEERAKKDSSAYWQETTDPNRCRACGVRHSGGESKCRACGCELGQR